MNSSLCNIVGNTYKAIIASASVKLIRLSPLVSTPYLMRAFKKFASGISTFWENTVKAIGKKVISMSTIHFMMLDFRNRYVNYVEIT